MKPLWGAVLLLAGCPLGKGTNGGGGEPEAGAPRIVVAERAPSGGSRLVVVAENGDRMAELVVAADEQAVDTNPAFSPDGAWVVFASSRDREFGKMSLWIARARAKATPIRLTSAEFVDMTPAWTPDGRAIVFASTRDGGDFDLWRVPITIDGDQVTAGEAEPLTKLAGQELSPAVAADGRIAFTSIEDAGGVQHARIGVRGTDGKVTFVTPGPADTGPAWSRDGASIAFTAPHLRPDDGGGNPAVDADLFLVPAKGGAATLLVDAPGTDETAPAYSEDGRWLFATSVFRSVSDGRPLTSSVIHVDTWEKAPTVRMLVDRVGPVPRVAITVAPGVLDASALHAAPSYKEALGDILRRALEAQPPSE
jgi:Tol biopolymer transport system component